MVVVQRVGRVLTFTIREGLPKSGELHSELCWVAVEGAHDSTLSFHFRLITYSTHPQGKNQPLLY